VSQSLCFGTLSRKYKKITQTHWNCYQTDTRLCHKVCVFAQFLLNIRGFMFLHLCFCTVSLKHKHKGIYKRFRLNHRTGTLLSNMHKSFSKRDPQKRPTEQTQIWVWFCAWRIMRCISCFLRCISAQFSFQNKGHLQKNLDIPPERELICNPPVCTWWIIEMLLFTVRFSTVFLQNKGHSQKNLSKTPERELICYPPLCTWGGMRGCVWHI